MEKLVDIKNCLVNSLLFFSKFVNEFLSELDLNSFFIGSYNYNCYFYKEAFKCNMAADNLFTNFYSDVK